MKKICLFSVNFFAMLICLSFTATATKIFTPSSINSISASKTYCQNQGPSAIKFVYNTCTAGTGGGEGTAFTVKWYSNTINSTTGGTLLTTTSSTTHKGATGDESYTPSTATVSILYYFCVITWTDTGTCNPSGSLTSPTCKIVVNGQPAPIVGASFVCIGSPTTLTNTMPRGTWSSNNNSLATVGSTGIVTGLASGTVNIAYNTGCGGTVTKTMSVNSTATVSAISGTTRVCKGANTSLSNATSGGTWTSSNTSLATVNSSGTVHGVATGMPTISYSITNSCGTSVATTTVAVAIPPTSISGATGVCSGSTTTLSNTANYGTWSSNNTTVATVASTSGAVTGVNAGTATITYTTGCGSAVTKAVSVTNSPITGITSFCGGSTTSLSDATSGGTWSSGNTGIATVGSTGLVTGVAIGSATISYKVGACASTAAVTVLGIPASTITGIASVCAGSTSTLSNATANGTWSSSNPSIATVDSSTGIVTGIAVGTCTITYSTGCGPSATKTFTVNTQPAAISGITNVCATAATTLTNSTGGGTWSSSNASVATVSGGVVTGVAEGSAVITYAIGSCFSTADVTVNPAANAGSITGSRSLCEAGSITLSDAIPGGDWSSSDETVAVVDANGLVSAITAGTANITYSMANSCGSADAVATLTVTAVPEVEGIAGASTICAGSQATLTIVPIGGVWSSSDTNVAAISATGVVTGVASGSALISYKLSNVCGSDFDTMTVVVNAPAPITGVTNVCVGSTTTLNDAIPGGTWSCSNTSVATIDPVTGIVNGITPGSATVTYTTAAGCTTTTAITVKALPSSITGTTTVCSGRTTALADATSGGTWSSGNTSIAAVGSTGIVTGVSSGLATISYTDGNGCSSTAVVTVNPSPAAIGFTTYNVCTGSTIALTNATPGGTWSSSSTTKATVDVNTGVVSGILAAAPTITYKLTSNGCFATKQITVSTTPQPITGTRSVCMGATTTLMDSYTGATWSSSNPSIASVGTGAGVVTGVAAGTATISYLVASTGCASVATVTVNPNPVAISGAPSFICTGSSVALSDATPGGAWTSSNTRVSVGSATGVVTGVVTGGTVDVIYQLPTGCKATTTMTVYLAASPITGPSSVCVGYGISLYDADPGGIWSVSNPSLATTSGSTVTGVAAGTPAVTYTNANGCVATKTITVTAGPSTISGSAAVCEGATVDLAKTLGDGYAATPGSWISGNGRVATVDASGNVAGVTAGSAVITYLSATGCAAARVTVNPLPASINGANSVCIGSGVTMSNVTDGGYWQNSNTRISVDPATGVVTGLAEGPSVVRYILNETGCMSTMPINVNPLPSVIYGVTSVRKGETELLVSGTPGGTWSSSDNAIALCTPSGYCRGIATGSAVVTYTLPATGCYTTANVTVIASGNRSVIANNDNGANATEVAAETSVYPNPATTTTLHVNASVAGVMYIYSIDGKEIKSYAMAAGVNTLSLPGEIVPGIYMCIFKGDNGTVSTVRLVYKP